MSEKPKALSPRNPRLPNAQENTAAFQSRAPDDDASTDPEEPLRETARPTLRAQVDARLGLNPLDVDEPEPWWLRLMR